jgi:beta-lactamase superfamily II metal-dependent hydrolase
VVSACLEIHQLNVSQGDAILVINRDLDAVGTNLDAVKIARPADPIDWMPLVLSAAGRKKKATLLGTVKHALLIDGGDDDYGGDVVAALEDHGVVNPKKYWVENFMVLASHYHDDHIAGLRSVFKERKEKKKFDKKKKKKIVKVELVDRYRPDDIYYNAFKKKYDPDTARLADLKNDITTAQTASTLNWTTVWPIYPGGFRDKQQTEIATISLGTGVGGIPITVTVLAAGQAVRGKNGSVHEITGKSKKVDQNDRSIVVMLQYGSFRYFLGGDIAGDGGDDGGNTGDNAMDAAGKKFYSVHADVETRLRKSMVKLFPATTKYKKGEPKFPWAAYCTVFKANHHGSSSSVDVYTLSALRPLLAVISAGLRMRFHDHPTQQVVNRLSSAKTPTWGLPPDSSVTVVNSISQIYLTECAKKVRKKAFNVNLRGARICGDVVIRPTDESIQQIQNATAAGEKLVVQVYGNGVLSTINDPGNELRPVTADPPSPAKAGSVAAGYALGPWLHEDTH